MKVYRFNHSVGSGWSHLPEKAKFDSRNTLILVFCSPYYRKNYYPLMELKETFPNSVIMGCSTSGEIHDDKTFDLSISASAIQFENTEIKLVEKKIPTANDSYNVGFDLANQLKSEALKGVFILSDGLHTNGSALIKGFNDQLDPNKVAISGGLAGDGNHFLNTWVVHNGVPKSNLVIAVGLYGESVQISNSTRGGWDIFGLERTITKSQGNIVYEIDGRPALELYKEYLGEKAKELPSSALFFPLQIRSDYGDDKRLVRTILSVDEKNQSLIFAGDLPQGFKAQLMKANFDRIIDGAFNAAESIKSQLAQSKNTPSVISDTLTIAITCVGRRLALGARAEEEAEVLKASLGEDANIIGFYSYGELAPYKFGEPCDLHNQSMTITHLSETLTHNKNQVA